MRSRANRAPIRRSRAGACATSTGFMRAVVYCRRTAKRGGDTMRKFMAGLILGVMLGGAAAAFAAEITFESGYLANWSVIQNGEEVCRDPFVSTSARQIECD